VCLAAARCLRLLWCLSDSLAVPGACLLLLPLHFSALCRRLYFVGSMSQICGSLSVRQGLGVPKEDSGAGEHHAPSPSVQHLGARRQRGFSPELKLQTVIYKV